MFEDVVAYLLNKYLGKYVQNLDSENLNVGIFSGTVQLTDLQLKPEALYELDLPVEVKGGCIGKISIDIPWTGLYSEPVLIHVEDILVLAGPLTNKDYDSEKQRLLMQAWKQKHLDDLQDPALDDNLGNEPRGFFENLAATIINNVQVSVQNIHIRYEDSFSNPNGAISCGVVLQSLTAITTNNRWKPTQLNSSATNLFKLLKLESFSIYMNTNCDPQNWARNLLSNNNNWKNALKKGLATFSIQQEEFEFIVKPISAKVKMIFNKSSEAKIPKLLVDFVLQDAASQLSRNQYLGILTLAESFQMMLISQQYLKYHPRVHLEGHAEQWWKYAYKAILQTSIRPYSWKHIQEHRKKYKEYKEQYRKLLCYPEDTQLKLCLQKLEDHLDVFNILMAREHAKIEFAKENPSCIKRKTKDVHWWSWLSTDSGEREEIEVPIEKKKTLWSKLTVEEKERLYQAIGYKEDKGIPEASVQYIAHKLNFTLANCTLSLINFQKEILVSTLTQCLISVETRPVAEALKISARTESFLVEGASIENDLVPIITADNISLTSTSNPVFAVDFEVNPLHVKADYGFVVNVEPVEVVYHEHALSEVFSFFHVPSVSTDDIIKMASVKLHGLAQIGEAGLEYAIKNHKTIDVNIDLKSPYFVIPQHGSLQKGGSVLVLDMGRLTVKSELQQDRISDVEDTKMEIDQRLYDVFDVTFSDIQVLFTDSGDEWRTARQLPESEIHLMPKVNIMALFSNSIEPTYRLLPRQKVKMTLPSLKLNLSDRRITLLAEFMNNLPVPHILRPEDREFGDVCDESAQSSATVGFPVNLKEVHLDPTAPELRRVKNLLCRVSEDAQVKRNMRKSPPRIAKYFSVSDHSDEETEEWARTVDLPGFDDNMSASNTIQVLLQLWIGEVVLHLARSSDHVDKPYLMLRIEKLRSEFAFMDYGPAIQASLGGIQLVDKLHTGSSGEYMELIRSKQKSDMITVLYRKVKANCPEFKSHFHQVEHSLVVSLTAVSVTFHREAFITLWRFISYVITKIQPKNQLSTSLLSSSLVLYAHNDPPVPPGSTKFGISARVDEVRVKLCDTDMEFIELKIAGLESDYILKANERIVLRANLTSLTVDDLMESTLYSKILSIEDDRLFDFKYVKNSPKHKEVGIEEESLSQKGDGSVWLRIGRMHFVYLHRIVTEVQHFFEPFTQPDLMSYMKKSVEHAVQEQIMELKKQGMKLHLSVDIHAPTIMVPQKSSSPNLLVLSLGDLSVENLFKEVHIPSDGSLHLVDNILMRLNSLQVCRAIILLDGILQHQEPILEPVKFRLDIKRALKPFHRDILMFDVTGSIDIIKINVGQKDLSTVFSIYQENFAEGNFLESKKQVSSPITPVEAPTPTVSEDSVRKLEAFFNSSMDVYKETSFSFVMEGIQLTLYTDTNEMLSSPVRDSARALTTFNIDEIHMSVEINNDRSLEFKCSLQSATLEDIRPESHLALRKIFQSYSGDSRLGIGIMGISLSMPPMVDLSYRQNSSGDAEVNILVEKTRLNLSISYILAVLKLIHESLPSENVSGVNENDSSGHFSLGSQQGRSLVVGRFSHVRLPSDTTSGYYSVVSSTENESRGLSVSAKLKKPEIILFADPMDKNSQVLVLKMDVIFDYSRNGGQENIMANVAGLHMLSCCYGHRKETMCTVLHPCDAEFSRTQKMTEDQIGMEIQLSRIDLHISSLIVQTIMEVTEELVSSVKDTGIDNFEKNIPETSPLQDLWSPKKTTPLKLDPQEAQEVCVHPSYPVSKFQETLALHIPELKITCDIVEGLRRVPVLFVKVALESDFHNWSKQLYLKADLQLEMMYYNEKLSTWEPLVEPVMEVENVYRPWEVTVKLFREKSQPIVCRHEINEKALLVDVVDGDQVSVLSKALTESSSSSEEVDDESEMTVIKKHMRPKRMASQKSHDLGNLVGYAPDSDSENEEGLLERITSAFGQLFSGESSDEGPSDSEELGDGETKSDSGDTETADASPLDDEPVFLDPGRGADEVDNYQDSTPGSSLATYIVINSSDNLNLNITSNAINVVKEVLNSFLNKPKEDRYLIPENINKPLLLKNFLGPESTISVLEKLEETSEYILLEEASGKLPGSTPISPGISGMLVDIPPSDTYADISGDETDGFNLRAFLAKRKDAPIDETSPYVEESIEDLYRKTTKTRISVKIEGFDILQCPMPHRAGVTMFALQPIRNKTRYYLIVDVDVHHGQKSIIVSSPLVIRNHLPDAVHILCKRARLEEVVSSSNEYARNPFHNKFIRLVTLESGESYNIPLFVAYHCKLYIQPAIVKTDSYKYDVSTEGLWWQDIAVFQRNRKHINCLANSGDNNQYCVKVTCVENKGVKCPAVGTKVVPNYTLHLYPPVIIHNALPYTLEIAMMKTGDLLALHEGESVPVLDVEPGHVKEISVEVPNYLGVSWKGKLELSADTEEHHTVLMQPDMDIDGGSKQLVLNVHLNHQHALDVYIYAPYWVVNKTGLPVQLKGSMSDVIYNTIPSSHEPLLFRFKKHKRKKARIRVYNSRWSPSFSLDTVGNTGVVVCHDKERNRKYKLFLSNQLSHLQLTKIITITPFLVVMNNTQQYLRFMEENEHTDLWLDIAPSQCLPFWPDTESMRMFVKYRDSSIISQHFSFREPCVTVLRMDHGSALCVEITGGSETPTVISFFPYCPGDAPVCVENLCEDLFLKINQKSLGQVTLLSPYQSVLYTWDDPSLERTLIWNLYNRKKNGFTAQIYKDGFGHEQLTFHSLRPAVTSNQRDKSPVIASSSDDDDSESEDGIYLPRKTRKDKVDVYWVSFLDGHQRVLLFTQDERIAHHARKAIDGEMATLECFLSLNSIGVSLINRAYTEVAYFGLYNAPPIWEIQINNSWKFLTLDLSAWLEDKWKAEFQTAQLKDYLFVDLSKMQMTKPFFGHLRRTYTPGLWLQFRRSDHQMYMHFKAHRMQVENQLPDAVFPTVFYSAPTPKAIIRRSGPRSFIELKLLTHRTENLNLDTIKYLNLLVQQMNVKLDKGFLLSVYDMYTSLFEPEEEKSLVKADRSMVEKPLGEINVGVGATRSQRTVFEYLHVSPLKILFSFSPRGGIHKAIPDPWSLQDDVLDFFLNSVGATLSEVKDVELRMAYFERKGALLTPSQLLAEVEAYYISQVVRQVYVLILGLDVLGNPFGLVQDFTRGLGDFFYEPFLGSVEGPEEFADGLARGAQSLLGHVIGGTATSISLISGSLGQALALLSFDEDYKKKRQQHIHQASSSLPNTLAVAAKGFVMGVALGLSGVVVKPVTGAHQEGVEGFFKGIGKGLMGLITKPAGGVVDMVSMAFDGIRRAAEFGEDVVVSLRLPRFINPSQGLKPYSPYIATGYKLLLQISKGHYADSDRYWAHAALSKEERSDVALITDRHVFLLEKCRFWGGWDVEWVVNLDNILSVPVVQGNHLVIKVRQDENLLNFSGDERYIKSNDPQVLQWLKEKIEKVLLVNMEDRPCPTLV